MTDTPHPVFTKAAADDWWQTHPTAPAEGCCVRCPIAAGCALAGDSYTTCPVTGGPPPSAPPAGIPVQSTGDGRYADGPGTDWSDIAGRGVETTVSAAFGFGWLDLATGLVERLNAQDADGNPVDWGRLQLKRNGLAILVATLVPLGDHTAAQWIARALHTYSLGVVFVPAGAALLPAGILLLGGAVPGPLGVLCRGCASLLTATARGIWRLCASPLGWILTRPAIWAALCGAFIVCGRFLIRILTGA